MPAPRGVAEWRPLADESGGRFLVREIGIRATSRGLGVVRSDGTTARSWPWTQVREIQLHDAASVGDLQGHLVALVVDDGHHDFLCSTSEIFALGCALARHAPHFCGPFPKDRKRKERIAAAVAGLLVVFVAPLGAARRLSATQGRHSAPARVWVPIPQSLKALTGLATSLPNAFGRWTRTDLRRRVAPFGAGVCALALIGGGLAAGASSGRHKPPAAARERADAGSIMERMEHAYDQAANSVAGSDPQVVLPAATTPPAPAPPSLAESAPLKPHEIFGFAPYWTLPDESGFAFGDLTTLAYFSLDVNANGTIDRSGPGWNGYESQDLADLVTAAHAAGDRVVLTATCFDQDTLNELTSSPAAASTLASSLVELVEAKNLDGVNLDFEGQGSGDQTGLDRLVAQVSEALDAADPHYQLTMDTYASSAGDADGFYDIPGLAPYVDAFFVMGYDMDDPSVPSPTAALTGPGFNDSDALEQYTSVVPASKVILGVPFYGYDWPTTGPAAGDPATGPATPLSYSQVIAAGHPVYWDPITQTPWTAYQVGNQWHQTWFDDPTSLALKAELANSYHIAGLGVWALGMDGNDPSMIAALLGDSPVVKDFSPAPAGSFQSGSVPASSTTTATTLAPTTTYPSSGASQPPPPPPAPATTTSTTTIDLGPYTFTVVWDAKTTDLSPTPRGVEPLTSGQPIGEVTAFHTDDPEYKCLESATSLPVYAVVGATGTYEVLAQEPAYCVSGSWLFDGPTPTGSSADPPGTSTATTTPSTMSSTTAGSATIAGGVTSVARS